MFLFHIQVPKSVFGPWIEWGQWYVGPGLCHVQDDLWPWPVHRRVSQWYSKPSTIVRQFVNFLYLYDFICVRVFSPVSAPCTFDMYDECMKRNQKGLEYQVTTMNLLWPLQKWFNLSSVYMFTGRQAENTEPSYFLLFVYSLLFFLCQKYHTI